MDTQTQTTTTGNEIVPQNNGINVTGPVESSYRTVLSDEALNFLATLQRNFDERRRELLQRREKRQQRITSGEELLDFLPETQSVRDGDWQVAPIVDDLRNRRVEITGPVERKMIINALNSGANVFMADFEDANSPTWDNCVTGQVNLIDAVRRTIEFTNPAGKHYKLNDETATLVVRPRGWHLAEKHVEVDGRPMSASLFDFGLYFFHNAKELVSRGSGPYFYLPKMESHLEARLWNDVFNLAQDELGIPRGTIRATVLIETIYAAFEMEEILYELREHSSGLNCGRWDYIFSIIKTNRGNNDFTMPDRGLVTMTRHNMHSYSLLAIKSCHRRGAHAIGGMAAQIPIKNDEQANREALDKVRDDKVREANDGHDGTWVAHPGLVGIAKQAFDDVMPQDNQIDKSRDDVNVTRDDLLDVPDGGITEKGVRHNIDVGIQYMATWLRGNGCVPLYNLMEDAATAEISRSQLWQWVHHDNAKLEDGRDITPELVRGMFTEVLDKMRTELGEQTFTDGKYALAGELIEDIVLKDTFTNFMTSVGYEHLS